MLAKPPKTQVTKLNGIQLQSSTYGLPLALLYGTNRVTANLIWYGNFKAIPHTQKQSGGKGLFSPSSNVTNYTYSAAVLMSLGEGGITGIGKVWKGKDLTTLSALGLTLITGTSGQSPWSFLSSYNTTTNWPSEVAFGYAAQNPAFTNQALGYDTTALLAASAYDLGSDATVPNHGFEYIGRLISAAGSGKDCNPKDVIADFLTNAQYGVGFASAKLGDHTLFSNYCLAAGILISPPFEEAKPASNHLSDILLACNTDPLWSDGLLKLIPRGDATLTGNGATYTPNLTPIYDLTDDDFLPDDQGPVRVKRSTPADAYNEVRIEFRNRANQYNQEPVAQPDQNSVEQYGLREAPIQQMHFITETTVAKLVAQTLVQRSVYIRNTFEFGLTQRYALLEPGDLVTLTDGVFNRQLVRLTSIEESEEGFDCAAEEVPVGVAAAALYPHDDGLRYFHDFNAAPLSVATPYIFELPADPSATGLSIGIAVGAGAGDLRYGGCHVWVSADGVNYQQVGMINGSSRYGSLTSSLGPSGSTLSVALVSGGQLPTVSATEAAEGATMIAVDEEYLDYTTATLSGTGTYNLTGLNRGFYETIPATHANGTKWARVDDSICRLEDLDLTLIGATLYFKFTAFNSYQGGEQALASVSPYTYAVTGYMQVIGQKAQLAKIGEDGWLTPVEKGIAILDYRYLTNEKTTLDAQADAVSISRTTYDTTYAALTTYLGTLSPAWNDTTTSTAVTRTTWDQKWGDFEDARRDLVVAVRGVDGTSPVTIYKRQYAPPSTPTGDNPSGWTTSIPTGTETVWQSTGTKTRAGSLIGVWSAPVVNTQGAARDYNGSITWYLGNISLFNGGTYEALQTGFSGQSPSGTSAATSYWGVRAAPGAAGSPGSPPSGFSTTISLTSSSGSNLRTIADAAGYTGAQDATITFNVPSGVTIRGLSGGGIGIDTGSWPTGSYTIALTLVVQSGGIVDGGGGIGGDGGMGDGSDGGDAIFCRVNMTGGVTINSGGTVRAGGGGGGGGSGHLNTPPGQFSSPSDPYDGGGGGGGGAPNGAAGVGEFGANGGSNGSDGSAGTTGGGGAGGAGWQSGASGGGFATAGSSGTSRGAGGAAGFAVRKNGFTATVTNSGTMTGSAA